MPLDASPSLQGGALRADDPDLVRYRCLLAALRPEAVDPMDPIPAAQAACHLPSIRDPMAGWGGIPKGYGSQAPSRGGVAGAAEVLAQVDLLPSPSPVVLRWLREHGDGHPRGADGRRLHGEGVTAASLRAIVRGACVGLAVAMENGLGLALPQADGRGGLSARREAAYLVGRRLLWGAAGAWGR